MASLMFGSEMLDVAIGMIFTYLLLSLICSALNELISRDHLRAAAQLRAATGVKTPDSLQVVAALAVGCTAFLTNDCGLPTIPGLRILQLSSYVLK